MATLQRFIHKPNKFAPYAASKAPDPGYRFVFSDNIKDWIHSKKVRTREYKMAKPMF